MNPTISTLNTFGDRVERISVEVDILSGTEKVDLGLGDVNIKAGRHTTVFTINANDLFGYGSDAVDVHVENLKWVYPIIDAYGDAGLDACLSYISGHPVLGGRHSNLFGLAALQIQKEKPEIIRADFNVAD